MAAKKINKAKTLKSEDLPQLPEQKPVHSPKTSFLKNRKVIIGLIVIAVLLLLYQFRSLFLVALVNGQPITRNEVIGQLEKQGGKQALESIITKTLIFQQAQKQNVKVEQKEIDDEIKKIDENLKKQGQNLEQALAFQGLTINDVKEQIALQKMLEKMVGKDVKVTDKEINDYIEKNKESLPASQNEKELKESVKNQISQEKLSEKVRTFIADLQQKAKITYFKTY